LKAQLQGSGRHGFKSNADGKKKMDVSKEKNLTWFNGCVSQEDRERLHGHKGAVIWFTGLSASGKSTIAHHLEKQLHEMGCSTYVFDGDNVRFGLCRDLGFSPADRAENIRRIGEMVRLFRNAGLIAITAFISPYRQDRDKVRGLVGEARFFEIFVQCPIEICASRDPKGLYQKAWQGLIKDFTGVSAPYEPPERPALVINSDQATPMEAAHNIIDILRLHEIIPARSTPSRLKAARLAGVEGAGSIK
jgi:adenylylsulfate kinase